MSDAIDRFTGEWAFLSNFHSAVLTWESMQFPTSEHAFNAGKTLDTVQRRWIRDAPTPTEAKRRGRSVQLREGWDERVRYQVMSEVLHAKFAARDERVHALLSTGDRTLIEGTTWHDLHWGICTCNRHRGAGQNHLGRMLMLLREEQRFIRS